MFVSLVVGAFALAACRAEAPAEVIRQYLVSEPWVINGPVVAVGDGAWFPLVAPANFGTGQPSGALGHVDRAGRMSLVALPTLDSYPSTLTVGSEGTLWFALMQGNGIKSSVDTGPQLAGAHGELGWRRPDGSFHHLALTGITESIVDLAPDAQGGVWFTAYAFPSSVYGYVDAGGTVKEHPMPTPLDCPSCRTPVPRPGLYAGLVSVGPAGTVWLEGQPNCTILQVDPATGRVLRQFTDTDSGGYNSECNSSAPLGDGGVAIPMHARVALVSTAGMTATTLPGADRWAPLEVTTSASGVLWCIASYRPGDANVTAPTLYKLTRTGSVLVSHPFPQVTVPASSRRTDAAARATTAPFDLGIRSISAADDGGLWFAATVSLWHLG
jgi:streptogramin lyase